MVEVFFFFFIAHLLAETTSFPYIYYREYREANRETPAAGAIYRYPLIWAVP